MQEILSPTPEGEYVGSAIVQEVFNIGGTGNIAGSKCRDGIIKKGSNVRVMRGDKILTESKVRTLRNFKVRFGMLFDAHVVSNYFLKCLHLNFYSRLKLTLLHLGMSVV
jgi:translation initiation factor IF-2